MIDLVGLALLVSLAFIAGLVIGSVDEGLTIVCLLTTAALVIMLSVVVVLG